ncbi:MAG: HDIG domain-containing metalloprotein [Pseudomonadota bacterium]
MKIDFLRLFKFKKKKKALSKIEELKQYPRLIKLLFAPVTYGLLACLFVSVIITLLIAPQLAVPQYNYKAGDIAKHNIRAPQDFSVEDKESTEKRALEKTEAVLSVYDFNSRAEEEIEKRILNAFSSLRDAVQKLPRHESFSDKEKFKFQELLKVQVDEQEFNLLAQREFKKELEDYVMDLALPFAQREIVQSKDLMFRERKRGISLRDIYTKHEITVEDFSPFIDVQEIDILLKRDGRNILKNESKEVRNVIINLALKLIEPTVTFNKIETNIRRVAAVQEVVPLFYAVQKDEIIVREGARINEAALLKLQAMAGLKGTKSILWTLIGYFLFSFLCLHSLYYFSKTNLSGMAITKITQRDFVFLSAVIILTFLLIKFSVVSANTFSKGYAAISLDSYFYAIPFASAALVISIVLSPPIASLSAIIIAIFSCIFLDNRFSFFVYIFISSLVASQEVRHTKERKTIIRAGLLVGTINAFLILSLYLITGDVLKAETVISMGLGFLGGILSAVLSTGIIPIIEMIFNYTTDIKMLELADLNQPVLRNLLIAAPGTYHHSILVGILAEAAAEAVNANPLLARVSAYYHDIGKIKKPLYFVENQKGGENKHDRLLPSMSSLIIISHIKDGVEIAHHYRLGKSIQNIISQHHGTSCINYFYQKAKEMQEDDSQPVSDRDFRYPGPRPQTKEAGIVMLADAVQATSKTLVDPSPSRIQGLVQRIINNIFVDGQLDECELTLKDLHLIAENFNRILNGIFHSRIEYPEKPEKDDNGKDIDKKPAKADTDRSLYDTENSERDLGRIGITKSRGKHTAAG